MTTITAFVQAIGGLTVSGVTRKVDHKPESIYTADLPFQFVELPSVGKDESLASTCSALGKTRTVELVVCTEAANQNAPEPNFDALLTMMDAMETALDTYESTSDMLIDYEIRAGGRAVGDAVYWSAIATVTGTDT